VAQSKDRIAYAEIISVTSLELVTLGNAIYRNNITLLAQIRVVSPRCAAFEVSFIVL